MCNRTKDGKTLWLAATVVPILGPSGRPQSFIAFRTDISKQKQTEAELRQARDQANAAATAKSQFLSNMSHEIRTPMNAIIGLTRLSLEQQQLTAELRDNLAIVLASASGLMTTLDSVLDFALMEAGTLALEPRIFDLAKEVHDALKPFEAQAHGRGLDLTWTVDEKAQGLVSGDPLRVKQILSNIVGNALKFSERGQIAVRITSLATRVTILVSDTGIGIPNEKIGALFKGFEQVDMSATRRFGGAGLGLSTTRHLVELMGGSIELESTVGVGTTVRMGIHLPLAPTEAAQGPTTAPARHLRVVVAEDNPVNQRLVQRLLERWGYEVEVVNDGLEAVARAAAGGVDLMLMDLDMPHLGGIDATRQIREREHAKHEARLPIIALTASSAIGDHQRCVDAGMDDYLPKPLNQEVLRRVLASHAAGPASSLSSTPAFGHRN